jgi:hypothetical protein
VAGDEGIAAAGVMLVVRITCGKKSAAKAGFS